MVTVLKDLDDNDITDLLEAMSLCPGSFPEQERDAKAALDGDAAARKRITIWAFVTLQMKPPERN